MYRHYNGEYLFLINIQCSYKMFDIESFDCTYIVYFFLQVMDIISFVINSAVNAATMFSPPSAGPVYHLYTTPVVYHPCGGISPTRGLTYEYGRNLGADSLVSMLQLILP